MSGDWYPIPGYSRYEASWDGQIRNRKTGRVLKTCSKNNGHATHKIRQRVKLASDDGRPDVPKSVARHVLSAKIGRPLESWEHACHGPGGPGDDSMGNLSVGCVLNNVLDDIEMGTRFTSHEELRRALGRIQALLASVAG